MWKCRFLHAAVPRLTQELHCWLPVHRWQEQSLLAALRPPGTAVEPNLSRLTWPVLPAHNHGELLQTWPQSHAMQESDDQFCQACPLLRLYGRLIGPGVWGIPPQRQAQGRLHWPSALHRLASARSADLPLWHSAGQRLHHLRHARQPAFLIVLTVAVWRYLSSA